MSTGSGQKDAKHPKDKKENYSSFLVTGFNALSQSVWLLKKDWN